MLWCTRTTPRRRGRRRPPRGPREAVSFKYILETSDARIRINTQHVRLTRSFYRIVEVVPAGLECYWYAICKETIHTTNKLPPMTRDCGETDAKQKRRTLFFAYGDKGCAVSLTPACHSSWGEKRSYRGNCAPVQHFTTCCYGEIGPNIGSKNS